MCVLILVFCSLYLARKRPTRWGGWDPRGIYRVGLLTLGNVASARVAQRAQIAAEAAGIPVVAAAAGAPPAVDAEAVDADGVAAGPMDPAAAAEPPLPIPPAAAAADAGPGQEGTPGAEGAGGVLWGNPLLHLAAQVDEQVNAVSILILFSPVLWPFIQLQNLYRELYVFRHVALMYPGGKVFTWVRPV